MIQNRRQYNVTKSKVRRLEDALGATEVPKERMPARVYRAMIAGIESLIEELRVELREYDELEQAAELHLESVEKLPEVLIKARVARGYTQKDLAERLKLKPQQIQKYEATRYRSVSFRRLVDIMKALDLDLQADIPLKSHK